VFQSQQAVDVIEMFLLAKFCEVSFCFIIVALSFGCYGCTREIIVLRKMLKTFDVSFWL
jgi:hypothetical protein